ncbi:MAG: HPr family phosphocarrier protein [Neisseriaceae bacterium]|nr:HPr family phosphocarrier protein [Neisseriaceae bacterium]MBP6862340.1 HPr family phosphocarrier protein [Neisseriaceae bacterium]
MISQAFEIINKLGLHARASSKFTQIASGFKSEIWVTRNDRRVNGKSIMGLMMLAAAKGCVITIDADGQDETEAIAALGQLINNRFDESE